jgi:hypothetical protein
MKRLASIAVLLLASCDSATPDEGRDASMQVANAQFVRGTMPDATDGPKVASVVLINTAIRAGATNRALSGALEPTATAAAMQLAGDPGYWILAAGVADVSSPGFPSYKTELSFASTLAAGPHDLVVRAVDRDGHFGPATTTTLTATSPGKPAGAFVVSLSWTNDADLDLHLVDPNGIEVFNRNPSSAPKPVPGAPPAPPGTITQGGVLDVDSNAQCRADGQRAENIVYASAPPKGHYVVRVDTASMCDEGSAYWRLEAFLGGVSIGVANGIATDADTRFSHDRGAGVLALELDVP